MIKFALIITTISIANLQNPPEITIPAYYNTLDDCNNRLNSIQAEINADILIDNNKNKVIRLENREYHHRSYIFWSCQKVKENS